MADDQSLGSDETGIGKAAYFLVIILSLFTFNFFLANATGQPKALADFYIKFVLVGLFAVAIDYIFRHHKAEVPDTLIYEKHSPFFEWSRTAKALFVYAALAGGGVFALLVGSSSTAALVAAPTFQAIDLGPGGSAFSSGVAGLYENLVIFYVLLPIAYVLLKKVLADMTGAKWIAAGLAILAASTVFTVFHIGVYGNTPQALDTVFGFGLMCSVSTVATGTGILCDSIHFWNNFAVTYFRQTAVDITLWIVLYELVLLAGLYAYLKHNDN